jgi:hypothetical protein
MVNKLRIGSRVRTTGVYGPEKGSEGIVVGQFSDLYLVKFDEVHYIRDEGITTYKHDTIIGYVSDKQDLYYLDKNYLEVIE